ncbi:MAG TPA: uroporphyrinogen decarboxylase family protein [Armatimonadota bacterium]|nr:uroporphyrinogen decarboxylase family protein [Armatimonadota bacterium]
MTSRERVRAAIDHREADRAPYVIDLCPDAWDQLEPISEGKSLQEFVDNDVLDIGVPWWYWHELEADWRGMDPPASRPKVMGRGSYAELTESVKRAKETSDKYLLVRLYGIHFEMAYVARGIENLLADMVGEPEFAKRLHASIVDRNLVMMENFLCLNEIDGVLLGSDWGSQRDLLMSPEAWDEIIAPGEQRMFDLVHSYGKDVWIHSCGNIEKIIPRLVEMGIDVLNPIQPEAMDIAALKRDYGDRLAFWGGISTQQTLPYGTPDELRAEARYVRDLMGEGGGYVFSPAQSIQSDVPTENILALLEVARESRST